MDTIPLPPQEILRQLLDYDPDSGKLWWRIRPNARPSWNSRHAGREAFINRSNTHRRGSINRRIYLAHRVIWKWMTGEEPPEIDHEDGDPNNNRFFNLKPKSHRQNQRNMKMRTDNSSGCSGVSWHKGAKKWRARVYGETGEIYLGLFQNIDDAIAAKKVAEREHGYHPNHGRNP